MGHSPKCPRATLLRRRRAKCIRRPACRPAGEGKNTIKMAVTTNEKKCGAQAAAEWGRGEPWSRRRVWPQAGLRRDGFKAVLRLQR